MVTFDAQGVGQRVLAVESSHSVVRSGALDVKDEHAHDWSQVPPLLHRSHFWLAACVLVSARLISGYRWV